MLYAYILCIVCTVCIVIYIYQKSQRKLNVDKKMFDAMSALKGEVVNTNQLLGFVGVWTGLIMYSYGLIKEK